MPDRPLSIEERQKFEARGIKIPVNAVVDEKGDIYEGGVGANPEVQEVSKPESTYNPAGLFPRQFARAAIPAALGGAAWTTAAAFAPATGGASLLVPLGAAALGALGGSYLQRKGIEAYTKSNPNSSFAQSEAQAQEDIKRHPVLSTISSLPASVFAPGGSFLPSVRGVMANPKLAAGIGGIQGVMSGATQAATTGHIDPTELAIATLGGPFFTKAPPRLPAGRPTTATTPMDAAAVSAADMGHTGVPKNVPIHQALGLELETLLDAPAKMLRQMAKGVSGSNAKFLGELAYMKEQNVPLTLDDLTTLSGAGRDFDKARMNIMASKAPAAVAAEKQMTEMLNEANKRNALEAGPKPVKKAEESAQIFEAAGVPTEAELAAARQKATEEGVASMITKTQGNPPSPSTAEQAAETILASKKASKPLEDPIAAFRKEESEIQKALTFAEQYPEGSPMREEITRIAYARRQTAEQRLRDSISGAARVTPEHPLAAGTEETKLPRELGEIEDNTQPETPNEPPETTQPGGKTPPPTTEDPKAPATGEIVKKGGANKGQNPATAGELKEVLEGIRDNPSLPAKIPAKEIPVELVSEKPPSDLGSPQAKRLGVAPKEGQKAAVPTPVQDFVNALGFTSADGGRARRLLATHPAIGGKIPKSVDLMRESYNQLPVGDRLRIADLYASGSENYVSKLAAAEQGKAAQARIGKTLKQPGKPTTPQPEAPTGLQVKQAQQKAAEKGGEAGSILNPFSEDLGRIAKNAATKVKAKLEALPEINELIGKGIETVGKVTVEPLKKGVKVGKFRFGGLQGVLERLSSRGPLSRYAAKALDAMDIHQGQLNNPRQDRLYKLGKTVTQKDLEGPIQDYIMWRKHGEGTEPKLTPEQRNVVDEVYKMMEETGAEAERAGPYVIRHTPGGKEIETPLERVPGHVPEAVDPMVNKFMRDSANENDPEWLKLREDYINYQKDKMGMSEEAAEQSFKNRRSPALSGERDPNARFRALRVEMGEGLPQSWRDRNIIRVMKSYMTKYSHDMSFHRFIESDPIAAKAFGITKTGRGEAHPETVNFNGRKIIDGELMSNPDVQAAFRHYIGGFDQSSQGLERGLHLFSAGTLQTLTQTKNFIQNVFKTPELLKADEVDMVRSALTKALTEEAHQTALKAGAVKATRNILPTVAQDVEGHITKIADLMTKSTGSEKLAQINDITLNEIGRMLAIKRIGEKDLAFIERFAPNNWREMDLNEVIDFMSTQFTRQFAGSYGPAGLPANLLRGNTSLLGRYFSLSRWSVERFNKWYNNVYEPATKGDLAPFFRSAVGTFVGAGVLNSLVQLVQNKKPKELTWKEYFNLGGKDHAYTIFSKMAAMSDMGLLSDVLFGAIQIAYKEKPRGFNNIAIEAAADTAERIGQFISAWNAGDVASLSENPKDFMESLLTLVGEVMKDRVQMVRIALQEEHDTGAREEKIARRFGYLPKSESKFSGELSNPFSQAGAYRREDTKQLGRIIRNRMEAGQRISMPDSELRTSAVRMPEGKVGTYYKFIEEAQGKEAKEAAIRRDLENTQKKYRTLSTAIKER